MGGSTTRTGAGRRLALAALLAVVLLAALAVTLLGGADERSGRGDEPASEGTADAGGPTAASPSEGAEGAEGAEGGTSPAGAPPPPGTTPSSGVEAAPTPAVTQQPGDAVRAEEATRAPTPVVDGPFPTTSESAAGRLVASYPTDVLPLAPGATVRSSSVSTSTERVQVALVAGHDGGDGVLAFYLRELRRQGFVEVTTTSQPGQAAVALRRDQSSVVVTTEPDGATYSLLATLVREDA